MVEVTVVSSAKSGRASKRLLARCMNAVKPMLLAVILMFGRFFVVLMLVKVCAKVLGAGEKFGQRAKSSLDYCRS